MPKKRSLIRPSGEVLPLMLRKKYNAQLAASTNEGADAAKSKKLPLHPASADADEANRIFTAEELEHKMIRASVVMIEIQKQLYRGEEVYVEDTHAHGNLYRGWDAFIDLRDGGSSAAAHGQPGAYRRMPADHRWFSASCKSVARSSRPHSRMSATPTPSARSRAATPVSTAPSPKAVLSTDASSSAASSSAKVPKQLVAPTPIATPKPVPAAVPAVVVTATAPTASSAPPVAAATPTQEKKKMEIPAGGIPLAAPGTPTRRNTRKRKQGEN